MKTIRFGICCFLLWAFGACVDPFSPEIDGYETVLVVEGRVLEGKRIAEVNLSRTTALDATQFNMVRAADVRITDDAGGEYFLTEVEAGVYQSDTNQLVGTPGLLYQLQIATPEGKRFESTPELLKAGRPIDDLPFQFEERVEGFDTVAGMQVYVNTGDPEGESRYYRWEYEETWIFAIPFPITGYWNTSTQEPEFFPADEVPQTCWAENRSSDIIIRSSLGLTEDRVERFPVRFVSTRGNELHRRYSILVKQYVLSEGAYEFWRRARNTSQDLGGLFDPIPTKVVGNISSLDDPEAVALGYFSADGVSSRRTYINRIDFGPEPWVRSGFEECELFGFATRQEMQAFVLSGNVFVDVAVDFFGNASGGYLGALPICADCRLNGTQEKPDFWE